MIDEIKESIKEKWLSYYEANSVWIKIGMEKQDKLFKNSEGGCTRPNGVMILTVITSLEPRLSEIMPYLFELNHDPEQIIRVLGLDFDPDQALAVNNVWEDDEDVELSHDQDAVKLDQSNI